MLAVVGKGEETLNGCMFLSVRPEMASLPSGCLRRDTSPTAPSLIDSSLFPPQFIPAWPPLSQSISISIPCSVDTNCR